jgi:hypothetical protein
MGFAAGGLSPGGAGVAGDGSRKGRTRRATWNARFRMRRIGKGIVRISEQVGKSQRPAGAF